MQYWETRLLGHFGPSRLSCTIWVIVGYFGPFFKPLSDHFLSNLGHFSPKIWSPKTRTVVWRVLRSECDIAAYEASQDMTLLHLWSPSGHPRQRGSSWWCCACCLAHHPPTRVAAPVSEQTNKEQRAPPAKQGGNGQLELLHSIHPHLARSSLQLQLKLCSPSLCALPHF